MPKKPSAIKRIEALEEKIESLDVQVKIEEIANFRNEAEQKRNETEDFKNSSESTKNEIVAIKQAVDEAKTAADQYGSTIQSQSQEYNQLKENLTKLLKRAKELEQTTETQLGVVSNRVLANSFKAQADELKKSVEKLFKWLLASVALLFVLTAVIIIWELRSDNDLLSSNLLIKAALTTPIVYYIFFISRQYTRDKRLYDQYSFKATVALSFEAYRKLVKEELGDPAANQEKILNFVINSVTNLYTAPIEKPLSSEDEESGVGVLSKLIGPMKELRKIFS